jgi:hypothetical protein
MSHLSPAEFVDLVERAGDLPAARVQHARTCARCRAEADALGCALALATADDVPAPSPLFWDHLPGRVADAIRNETIGDAGIVPARWWRGAAPRWAAMLATAALVVSVVVWRAAVYAPAPAGKPVAGAAHDNPVASPDAAIALSHMVDADEDPAWAVVRAAADDLPWEEAHAAGLSARPDAVEGLALELTAEERLELARLLGQELKRNGV